MPFFDWHHCWLRRADDTCLLSISIFLANTTKEKCSGFRELACMRNSSRHESRLFKWIRRCDVIDKDRNIDPSMTLGGALGQLYSKFAVWKRYHLSQLPLYNSQHRWYPYIDLRNVHCHINSSLMSFKHCFRPKLWFFVAVK